jgi:hypothetical protein
MRERSTGLFCALLMLLLWVSAASASPFHHHEKKGHAFETHKAGHACPMNHHQKGLPCPHAQNKKDGKEYQIAPDCGGSPLASIPTSVDFSKNLSFVSDSSLPMADDTADGFILKSLRHKFSLSFLLDHPPKSL